MKFLNQSSTIFLFLFIFFIQVTLYHLLKLFSNPLIANQPIVGSNGQLVSEYYDEIMFHDPSVFLYKQLTANKVLASKRNETDWRSKESKTLLSIKHAKKRVGEEVGQINERLKKQKIAIQKIKEEIAKLEKQQQPKT